MDIIVVNVTIRKVEKGGFVLYEKSGFTYTYSIVSSK